MNELHVVVIVSQVPEFVCKLLSKTVIVINRIQNKSYLCNICDCVCVCVCVCVCLLCTFIIYL